MAHHVARQHRPRRHRRRAAIRPLQGDAGGKLGGPLGVEIRGKEHARHAGHRARRGGVCSGDARMREGCAEHHGLEQSRMLAVGGVEAATAKQPVVLPPNDVLMLEDEHGSASNLRFDSAAHAGPLCRRARPPRRAGADLACRPIQPAAHGIGLGGIATSGK
jgi:hypothetical protein